MGLQALLHAQHPSQLHQHSDCNHILWNNRHLQFRHTSHFGSTCHETIPVNDNTTRLFEMFPVYLGASSRSQARLSIQLAAEPTNFFIVSSPKDSNTVSLWPATRCWHTQDWPTMPNWAVNLRAAALKRWHCCTAWPAIGGPAAAPPLFSRWRRKLEARATCRLCLQDCENRAALAPAAPCRA
jgi:hypothetical protein